MNSGIVVGVDGSRGAVLFVIDVSGSMDGEKIVAAKQSAITAANTALKRSVPVGMLSFSGDCDNPDLVKARLHR